MDRFPCIAPRIYEVKRTYLFLSEQAVLKTFLCFSHDTSMLQVQADSTPCESLAWDSLSPLGPDSLSLLENC